MSERNDYMIDEAYDFALKYHKNQKRKYTNEPYIVHPLSVAHIIEEAFKSTNELYMYFDKSTIRQSIIISALLHDTVEDTEATFNDIENKFGICVRNIVFFVTNISKQSDGNRKQRKLIDMNHTLNGGIESIIVKLADIIDNCSDICTKDFSFGQIYLKEKQYFLNILNKKMKSYIINDDHLFEIYNILFNKAKGVIENEIKYNI